MKRTIAALILFVLSGSAFARYECKEHKNFLVLESNGTEHVNHRLLLNGKVPIKELENGNWFVEKIACAPDGFDVEASHAQYNDSSKQKFHIKVLSKSIYEIK